MNEFEAAILEVLIKTRGQSEKAVVIFDGPTGPHHIGFADSIEEVKLVLVRQSIPVGQMKMTYTGLTRFPTQRFYYVERKEP